MCLFAYRDKPRAVHLWSDPPRTHGNTRSELALILTTPWQPFSSSLQKALLFWSNTCAEDKESSLKAFGFVDLISFSSSGTGHEALPVYPASCTESEPEYWWRVEMVCLQHIFASAHGGDESFISNLCSHLTLTCVKGEQTLICELRNTILAYLHSRCAKDWVKHSPASKKLKNKLAKVKGASELTCLM